MEGAGGSIKFGLAGIAVGSATAFVTDKVYGMIAPSLMGKSGAVGQGLLTAVVGGALASVMIFAGDRVLESMMDMGGDPLFRTTYYQAAFLGSGTARMAVANFQGVLSSLMPKNTPVAAPTPDKQSSREMPYTPMPVNVGLGPQMGMPPATPSGKTRTPGCAAGMNCGSIML